MRSFALYGFPESHAASFALIAYASAYLKAHHPTAFLLSLLNAWPMGFYHPATLIKDAERHGVEVRPIDVTRSGVEVPVGGAGSDRWWRAGAAAAAGGRMWWGAGAGAAPEGRRGLGGRWGGGPAPVQRRRRTAGDRSGFAGSAVAEPLGGRPRSGRNHW
jgi:error-prone DNA polymerase